MRKSMSIVGRIGSRGGRVSAVALAGLLLVAVVGCSSDKNADGNADDGHDGPERGRAPRPRQAGDG